MLLLPQGFNSVPGKSPDKAVAASAASEVGTFHLSGPPNRRHPRETRTAAIPLLCPTGRETRKPRRILNPRSFHLHTALSITCNLTRVNRNTQARGKSLPTCTNTLAWDLCWVCFFSPPIWGLDGAAMASPRKCLSQLAPQPAGFLAARRGNPQSLKAEPLQPCSPCQGVRIIKESSD